METISVKDLMVPLDEYATVLQDANLYEAVLALEEAQMAFDPSKHKHLAILVLDNETNVVGKLDMIDILMALEPKYGELEATGMLSRSGYSPDLIKSLFKDNFLWREPLEFICNRSFTLKVRDFMEVPESGVYIDESAKLGEAIHQLILCRYRSICIPPWPSSSIIRMSFPYELFPGLPTEL